MLRRSQGQRQKIHLLMKNGSLLVDDANRIGSQLVSDLLNGVAIPGREMPTPSFIHRELNRAPAPNDDVDVHTVNARPVEHDSEFLNVDAREIWDAARTDLESESDTQRRFERWLLAIFTLACAAFLLVAVAIAVQAAGGDEKADAGQQGQQAAPTPAPTPPPAPILPRVGGN